MTTVPIGPEVGEIEPILGGRTIVRLAVLVAVTVGPLSTTTLPLVAVGGTCTHSRSSPNRLAPVK